LPIDPLIDSMEHLSRAQFLTDRSLIVVAPAGCSGTVIASAEKMPIAAIFFMLGILMLVSPADRGTAIMASASGPDKPIYN
jgi:hypothetical protein